MTNIGFHITYQVCLKRKIGGNMEKFALCLSVSLAILAFAVDILCTGQGNQGELIEIELDPNARGNTVTIEGNQYQLTINNDFVYVWQNTLDDLLFNNA